MYKLIPSSSAPNQWAPNLHISKINNIFWEYELEFGLREMRVPVVEDKWNGYVPAAHNSDTFHKLMPEIKSNPRKFQDFRGLFAFQKTYADGKITIKGALQHRMTGKVVLLSASNIKPDEKHFPSQIDGWHVFNSYMIAPICFWEAFKAC